MSNAVYGACRMLCISISCQLYMIGKDIHRETYSYRVKLHMRKHFPFPQSFVGHYHQWHLNVIKQPVTTEGCPVTSTSLSLPGECSPGCCLVQLHKALYWPTIPELHPCYTSQKHVRLIWMSWVRPAALACPAQTLTCIWFQWYRHQMTWGWYPA